MKTTKRTALTATVLGGLLVAGAAFAQTPTTLNVVASAPASIAAGAQDTAVLTLALTNPGAAAVSVSSIPVAFSDAGILTDCRLQNAGSTGAGLNTGGNTLPAAQVINRIMLDTPLSISGGSSTSLTLNCDVSSAVADGKTFGVAVQASGIMAMSNGATTTPVSVGLPAGAPFSAEMVITGGTGTPTTPTVPGVPNTGAGGAAPLVAGLIGISGLLALAGIRQLRRT